MASDRPAAAAGDVALAGQQLLSRRLPGLAPVVAGVLATALPRVATAAYEMATAPDGGDLVTTNLTVRGYLFLSNGATDGARLVWRGGANGTQAYRARMSNAGYLGFFPGEGAAESLILTQDSRVGLGIAAPAAAVHVVGPGGIPALRATGVEILHIGGGSVPFPTTPSTGSANLTFLSSTAKYRIAVQDGSGRNNHYWNAYDDVAAAVQPYCAP